MHYYARIFLYNYLRTINIYKMYINNDYTYIYYFLIM